jgi:hypothetical protein
VSVQVDTLSITVPGHVVRKNTGGADTTLVLTGEQAAYVFESLWEVSSLFAEHRTPAARDGVVCAAADTLVGGDLSENVSPTKLTAVKASE